MPEGVLWSGLQLRVPLRMSRRRLSWRNRFAYANRSIVGACAVGLGIHSRHESDTTPQ
jgi:hypothetical protein